MLLKTGDLYSKDFCYGEVPTKYDIFDFETYRNNPMEFYVVCTDVTTGEPVYKKCDNFDNGNFEWIRASASMPLVSNIVEIDGMKLLDGGISDSVPIKHFEKIGYDKNIVVLTQPRGYRKKKNMLTPLMRLRELKYPKIAEAMAKRHIIYNQTSDYIDEMEAKGNILVLRPDKLLDISKTEHDAQKLKNVYELGRKAALDRLDEIKEYLS